MDASLSLTPTRQDCIKSQDATVGVCQDALFYRKNILCNFAALTFGKCIPTHTHLISPHGSL